MKGLEKEKQSESSWFIDAIEKHIRGLYSEVAEAPEKYRLVLSFFVFFYEGVK